MTADRRAALDAMIAADADEVMAIDTTAVRRAALDNQKHIVTMTDNNRHAALVEKVADLVRFNHDPIAIANEAIALIRAEVLEEAARVADQAEATDRQAAREPNDEEELAAFMRGAFKSRNIAAAIRALKGGA